MAENENFIETVDEEGNKVSFEAIEDDEEFDKVAAYIEELEDEIDDEG